ncbi:C40 family peptidase [Salinibacterium sp. ZJ454]|uniref:C40 family peptidase n=1 Tax=Salinibacterium sp. ZJ454 TaxID=2708339 RepID=UPI00142013D5|nr:C40 family peptidase [Salinibacterium sp. ZJ454]
MTLGNNLESSDSPQIQPQAPKFSSRRELRASEATAQRAAVTDRGVAATIAARKGKGAQTASTVSAAGKGSAGKPKKKPALVNLAVMTLVVPGLFATVALPAYAFTPGSNTASENDASAAARSAIQATQSQELTVTDVALTAATRDAFTATTPEQLQASQAAAARQVRIAAQRAAQQQVYSSYSGPSAGDYVANPAYPNFSLDQVVSVARSYQGVPYVYGGADPSGFDCSGFVQFVYAQFGISLPHSVTGQNRMGTKISREDARPGDVVIFTDGSHNGFWMGNGNILDAPRAGKAVQTRPLWTDAYHIVRLGI